jgi:pantoate--beta-alanine ligase
VVLKLFHCVQPAVAVFGKKDYQQLQVIEAMTRQFALPIQIVGHDTVRAGDGLALSSRNGYLSKEERHEAVTLQQVLHRLADAARDPGRRLVELEAQAAADLRQRGWAPDYLTLRRRSDLLAPTDNERCGSAPLVVLGAARLGSTRLIDNLEL